MDYNHQFNSSVNDTYYSTATNDFPLDYRIIATLLHSIIFILGSTGNGVLICVARKSKSLKTPTYAYLVSLAYADLLVIITAVPEAIAFHNLGRKWILGEAGCAIFIFLNFLGINAGSLSILAFTIERYFAICRPFLAQKHCTLKKTRRIIMWMWIFAIIYCSPWFGLTEVKSDEYDRNHVQCDFRLTKNLYLIVFGLDLLLFYIVPLTVAVVIYIKIGRILYKSVRRFNPDVCQSASIYSIAYTVEKDEDAIQLPIQYYSSQHRPRFRENRGRRQLILTIRSRLQVLRMLALIVVLFAVAWLPFRGLLVYNTFVSEPWLDIWYLLFAKTLIYLNSAINPLLYNWMSPRFRAAVDQIVWGKGPINKRTRHLIKYSAQAQMTPRFPPQNFFNHYS